MAVCAYSLFSSSSGNCTYVSDGETSFLIDAGGAARRIVEALSTLGTDICRVTEIFVTHEHGDHIKGIRCLCKKTPITVHAAAGTSSRIDAESVITHPPLYSVRTGGFTVKSFVTSHDAASSCGYVIEHTDGFRLGTLTDTGCVTDEMIKALDGCFAVMLESNYDEGMLINGVYPAELKSRISSNRGHLSNAQCAETLPLLYKGGMRRVLLAHLSPENNTPGTALASALEAKKRFGLDGLEIECADRFRVTRLV